MSTPKASPRNGNPNAKSSTRPSGAGLGEVVPSTPSGAAAAARESGDMPFAFQPTVSLHSLKELMRPSAASRIDAVARVVHMTYDHSAVPNADDRKRHPCTNTRGVSDLSPSSVLNAAPTTSTRPPPSSLVEVTVATPPNIHSLTSKDLDTSFLASGALPVPPLSLVVECAKQLDEMLAQWRTRNEGERCFLSSQPLPSSPSPKEGSPADQLNQNDAVPRTAPVRGPLGGRRPSMSQPQPGGNGSATPLPSVRSCAQHIQQMMRLVLWYCLSTTEDSRLAASDRSRGVSGFATPARPGASLAGASTVLHQAQLGGGRTPFDCRKARSGRPGSAWLTGGSLGSGGRSGTCSADPLSAHNWLGSRMSSASSTAGAPNITISEDELADRLFRLAVDAVVLLQGSSISSVASSPFLSSSRVHISDQVTRMGNVRGSDPASGAQGGPVQSPTEVTGDADATAIELQTSALWTLAAVLVRFADASLSVTVFLPVLFPQVDVRLPVGAAVRHPLLQPLLRGDLRHVSLQCSAAAALTTLLQRLRPTLQYAEEPQKGRPTAFLSLAAQCGTVLASLHEGLCWGLGQQCENAQRAASDAAIFTSSLATALPILDAYATVVAVTPYHRCPHSHAVVLETLQLPVMRFFLSHHDAAAFTPATQFVSNVLKNDSVRGTATKILGGAATQVGEKGSSNASQAQVTGGDGAAADAAADAAATFLPALLSHADTRVEVWCCMVPLSRLYPRVVQREFDVMMTPSVSLVSALTEWEASEKIADAAAIAAASSVTGLGGDATLHTASPLDTLSSPAKYTVGGGGGSAEKSGAPPPTHGQMRLDGSEDVVISPVSQRGRSPTALLDAFAECLRTWLHYMGYVWRAFDDNASDPAQRLEGFSARATLEHKRRIHEELLRPAMRLRRCGDDVRTMTLRCIAQIGNEYVSTLVDRSLCEELVGYVQSSLADAQPRVRGEALTTLGVWLWQYTSLDDFACVTIDSAVHSLTTDPNHVVRAKAAFALSNVTARLPEGSCAVVRDSPDYIATLCATAMHAAVIDTEGGVQGQGIRMMNHLLQVLTLDELISEVIEFEEGVAEGFLRVLLECLCAGTRGSPIASEEKGTSAGVVRYAGPREAKHRWNAACALGMGLARREVFEAEPKYAVEAVEALCTAVVHDHIFKVRTQAAGALARIPGHCLSGAYSVKDLTPVVVGSLCQALETASSTENFRQYKEQGTLHDALRSALAVMITSAVPSNELEKVFTSYTKLLQKEALL